MKKFYVVSEWESKIINISEFESLEEAKRFVACAPEHRQRIEASKLDEYKRRMKKYLEGAK